TGKYTSSVGIKFINPASEYISAGITQGSAGKRQAAAVVKIMFNGNLFCVEVRISPLIRWPNLLCHYNHWR
uniref:hypothetical protein n=1 Tax=Escherichia coli TaxID=562 RepID=UPI001BC8A8BE